MDQRAPAGTASTQPRLSARRPPPTTRVRPARATDFGLDAVVSALAGTASGLFGAYCYYSPALRSIAHSVGLWVLVALVCSARRMVAKAILQATIALVLAVPAFYVGKHVMFNSHSIDSSNLALWTAAAVVGGVALGVVGWLMGRPDWLGALAAALASGLLLGDAYARIHNYSFDAAAWVGVLGAAAVFAFGCRSRPQAFRVMVLLVPMTIVGYGLVSTPNLMQQILIEGL